MRAGMNILVTRSLMDRPGRILEVILIRPKLRAAEKAWFDSQGIHRTVPRTGDHLLTFRQ